MMPAAIWIILFTHLDHFTEALMEICMFCLVFGIPAIYIGWIVQCIAVMIRRRGQTVEKALDIHARSHVHCRSPWRGPP